MALELYFHWTSLVASGVSNTAWSGLHWKVPYYVTPYLVIVVTAVALYGRRVSAGKFDLRRDKVIGIAAAAASLAPFTMFRADTPHFLGSATALAALIVLTIAYLPGLLFQQMRWREPVRLVLVAAFIGFYSLWQVIGRAYPNIDAAARGAEYLERSMVARCRAVWKRNHFDRAPARLYARAKRAVLPPFQSDLRGTRAANSGDQRLNRRAIGIGGLRCNSAPANHIFSWQSPSSNFCIPSL